MNKQELSELVAGRVLEGKLGPSAVNAGELGYPYNDVVNFIVKSGFENPSSEESIGELVKKFGYTVINTAMNASRSVGDLPVNWMDLLHEAAVNDEVATFYERQVHKLRGGEDVNMAELVAYAHKLDMSKHRVVSADKITPIGNPYVPSHYPPIDNFLGGLPRAGLTVIGAPPGVGKTSLMLRLAINTAKAGKKSMLFSLEMTQSEILHRLIQMEKLTPEERSHILVCDEILSPGEVSSVASLVPDDIHFIGIDFAELLITRGSEKGEAQMADVYQTLVYTAKLLQKPVVLLSQLSRAYQGGLPQITHLRYTGMAEALASVVILLYNPNSVYVEQNTRNELPKVNGKGYLIIGKSRFGSHGTQCKASNIYPPGRYAIQVDWDGAQGWGNTPPPHWAVLP